MKRKPILIASGAILALLIAFGVYTQFTALSYDTFISQLRTHGATVTESGQAQQPFLSTTGRLLTVNSERIEVHEYATTLFASLDAGKISRDGSRIGNTQVDWVAPPHFYQRGRLLVLYNGSDSPTLTLLTSVLGQQIAGAAMA